MSTNYEDDDIPWDNDDANPFEDLNAPTAPPVAAAAPKAPAEPAISRPARGAFSARGAGGESPAASQPMPEEGPPLVPPAPKTAATQPVAQQAARPQAPAPAVAASGAGYAENYQKLRRAAQALREQQEPDLDALIPLVDSALEAYKGCKARIDQVKALLGERLEQLEDTGQKPAGPNGAR